MHQECGCYYDCYCSDWKEKFIIRIAIAGVGNCASSLIQGIHYYRDEKPQYAIGLMHWEIGGFKPSDIEVVAAFDIDKRKVDKDINEAIFSPLTAGTRYFCFCFSVPNL